MFVLCCCSGSCWLAWRFCFLHCCILFQAASTSTVALLRPRRSASSAVAEENGSSSEAASSEAASSEAASSEAVFQRSCFFRCSLIAQRLNSNKAEAGHRSHVSFPVPGFLQQNAPERFVGTSGAFSEVIRSRMPLRQRAMLILIFPRTGSPVLQRTGSSQWAMVLPFSGGKACSPTAAGTPQWNGRSVQCLPCPPQTRPARAPC